MQTNRRWIRSWLPWNLDRIFSLVAVGVAGVAVGATSSPIWSEEQEPTLELLQRRRCRVGAQQGLGLLELEGRQVKTKICPHSSHSKESWS
jgi:hypothetical protein